MQCTNPNGCTLDQNEMATRVAAWKEVSAHAISRRVEGTRITSAYPSDPHLVGRLRDLIAAEADCCSFLAFTVKEGPLETVLELDFPEEARGLIDW
ncbi:MAG: hypothetical protein LC808_38355 [Actinobacteria bacterium]|nr:hypothetical protein [Actinomycetota bacterium]